MLSQSLENRVSSVKIPVIVAVSTAAIVMALTTIDDLSGIIINAIAVLFMAVLIVGPIVIVGIVIKQTGKSRAASTTGKIKQLTKKHAKLNAERDFLAQKEAYLNELAAMQAQQEKIDELESRFAL